MFSPRPDWRLVLKKFGWSAVSRSDIGRVRPHNEDATFRDKGSGVFIVADGMGGRAAGEVASGLAAEAIGTAARGATGTIHELREHLSASFLAAGQEVARQSRADSAHSGMGTTCTALMLRNSGDYLVGHIGDSRAYRLRNETFTRVTRDHSWVQDQVDRGLIKLEEARGHPSSYLITRAIGVDATPSPDLFFGELQDGDVFLLTSDGLTDLIDDERIAELLSSEGTLDDTAESLITEANEAGGFDNITVLLVKVRRLEP